MATSALQKHTHALPLRRSFILVASGGTPVPGPATENEAIALMTMLGPCNGLSSSTSYPINEVTTIGAVWPLSPYMRQGGRPDA